MSSWRFFCDVGAGSACNAENAADTRITPEQLDSIKELINIDHLYSKPLEETAATRKPTITVQLSRSSRLTKLIKQDFGSTPTSRTDKPTALCEKTVRDDDASADVLKEAVERAQNIASSLHQQQPMLCAAKPEPADAPVPGKSLADPGVLDFDNLDEELDIILNECCTATQTNLRLPLAAAEPPASPTESDASNSLDESHASLIETPTTIPEVSDLFSSFDESLDYGPCLSGDVPTELFPQLACFIA